MNKFFNFIKKHFWEKWLWGVSTLPIILGIPAFFVDTLKSDMHVSLVWVVLLILTEIMH
jgi:hypothetical protein